MNIKRLPYYTAAFWVITIMILVLSMGWQESTDRLLIRLTAKCSLILFLLAFTTSAINRIWPGNFSRKLLQSRRYLGLSFAVSHTVHLCFVLLLQFYFQAQNFEERGAFTVLGGAAAYVLMYVMAFTSTNHWQKRLGWRNWRRLHTIGNYYIFIVFCVSYLPRALGDLNYVPFAGLLILALGLRGWALRIR